MIYVQSTYNKDHKRLKDLSWLQQGMAQTTGDRNSLDMMDAVVESFHNNESMQKNRLGNKEFNINDENHDLPELRYLLGTSTMEKEAEKAETLIIVLDDGRGVLTPNTEAYIRYGYGDNRHRVPTMVDMHINGGKNPGSINPERYRGAKIMSMDKEALDALLSEHPEIGSPSQLRMKYGWENLVVNNKLHSVWFDSNGAIYDFKYKDGKDNEATFHSKREIIAGFAVEFQNNGYKMLDENGEHAIRKVFREYWPEGFESEKKVSAAEALAALGYKSKNTPAHTSEEARKKLLEKKR
ncbi:MAG: hypothetical protein FWD15_00890 [Alphaproteobacteria bacterium]|nr:hypothetical protein [Alphaproteobacteria bacterium]